jgi:Lar family restriction alleviation protein
MVTSKEEVWKPCPFCGGTDIRHDRHPGYGRGLYHQGEDVYSMCCYQCGATFPNRYKLELLRDAWNRRVAPETDEHPATGLLREWLCASDDFDMEDWTRRTRDLIEDGAYVRTGVCPTCRAGTGIDGRRIHRAGCPALKAPARPMPRECDYDFSTPGDREMYDKALADWRALNGDCKP